MSKAKPKHRRAIINNILYEVAVYEDNYRTIVCEDVNHPTVKGYFDEERMAFYTSEGYRVFLDSCAAFQEFVEWGIPISE